MAGKIFFRERTKHIEGERMPRFKVVAVAGNDVRFRAKHFRKEELAQIAEAVGAELVELKVADKGHRFSEDDEDDE